MPYRSIVITIPAVKHLITLNPAMSTRDTNVSLWIRRPCLDNITLQRDNPFDHYLFWLVRVAIIPMETTIKEE